MKAFGFPLALAALLAPALASADYYRYETDEGVVAFTDDAKRVPSRYRDQMVRVMEQSLFDYARVTIVPRGATNTAAWAASNAESAASPSETAGRRLQISSNPSSTTLDLPAQAEVPVVLERTTEWSWVDGRYVPHTVVRHDGKIVSVVRLR